MNEKQSNSSVNEILDSVKESMRSVFNFMKSDLASIRTGRADPELVKNIKIDYYGASTPLNQLSSISAPDATLLVIQPWDRTAIKAIESELLKSEFGFNPSNDGNVIRIPIPPLSLERRKEMVKLLKKRIEEFKIRIRNSRRDGISFLKILEKDKEVSEDESRYTQGEIQKLTDKYISDIDQFSSFKETEITEV